MSIYIKSKCRYGNWIINLSVLLCNPNIIISKSCDGNNDTSELPANWPCLWNEGVIPFVFDYFAVSPKRLMSLVQQGHEYIEERSCLVFKEYHPTNAARNPNLTYLFYSYSEVLESCCLPFFTKATGRRLILITPVCSRPTEVGHATIHALGIYHAKKYNFPEQKVRAVLNIVQDCNNYEDIKEIL